MDLSTPTTLYLEPSGLGKGRTLTSCISPKDDTLAISMIGKTIREQRSVSQQYHIGKKEILTYIRT
jgi:hypothetical protein